LLFWVPVPQVVRTGAGASVQPQKRSTAADNIILV
jgi:hypothetical protein